MHVLFFVPRHALVPEETDACPEGAGAGGGGDSRTTDCADVRGAGLADGQRSCLSGVSGQSVVSLSVLWASALRLLHKDFLHRPVVRADDVDALL